MAMPIVLAACSEGDENTADTTASASAAPVSQASASASASSSASDVEGVEFKKVEKRDGGTFDFSYSWPAEVSAEPKLAAALKSDMDSALASERAEWEKMIADAPADCVSCRSRGFSRDWEVVADLSRFLSLSMQIYGYTGGAHGNGGTRGVVWDRQAEARVRPMDFFTSAPALENAVHARYCPALNRERERKRGMPVDPNGDDMFSGCPSIDELRVLLGSSDGKAFDRIGLIADPYVAGSYAEGSYEVTLPVTTALLDAVRPEYRAAFALRK